MRNHLQAFHKKEFSDMVKEEEEEKKTKVPQGVKKDETPKISDAFKKMTDRVV